MSDSDSDSGGEHLAEIIDLSDSLSPYIRPRPSSSVSPEGSSDEEDTTEEKIAEIQKQLDSNPYSYDLHVQLIALCRKMCDLDKLRNAREKMSEIFPLTPELWLDWLTDEKNLATTSEQKEKMVQLFERAVKDYVSVSVWLEYVQFSIGNIGETWVTSGLNTVRETFERAITAVGIHVTQGCLIWEAYREFETVYLLSLKSKMASEEEIKQQEDRIYNLFKRQLSIPLIDMEKTYNEFKELFKDSDRPDTSSIDYSYNKALQKLKMLQKYEENLFASESPHYEDYKLYIEYEKSNGDPSRVQNIYERAIVENCLKEELWLDYTKYMDKVIKIQEMSLPVHERAVRNCPWCARLWVNYGRALERYEKPHEKITGVFETALTMGFSKEEDFKEMWLAYLDYHRRRVTKLIESGNSVDFKEISDIFERAVTHINQYFWGSESQYIIMKYLIFFTAKYKKDISNARQLWKEVIATGRKEEARVWLDYANFEKMYGNATHYRKALLNALSCVSDWPETFVDLLLTFEREEGTLESFEKSEEKCESELKIINQKRLKKMEDANVKKNEKRTSRTSKRQTSSKEKQDNVKSDSDVPIQMDAEGFKIPPPPPDRVQHMTDIKNENSPKPDKERTKRPNEEMDQPEPKKKKVEVSENHGVTVQHDPLKDDRTVFLSNLSYDVGEEEIKNFCSSVGEIEEIRLVKDYKGRSKGYCYVVYKSELDAKKALEKDREKLEGRPVLVSPCEDRKNKSSKHPKLKFSTGLEKNKVFVKNIPYASTEKDLEELFKEHGALKSVRIVTYRNGHSKGLAYVEYEDENSAANAVLKMDGAVIENKVISCAISNPPPRRERNEFSSGRSFSYSKSSSGENESSERDNSGNRGAGSSSKSENKFGPRGRGRTQLSMVPRAIARPPAKKNVPNSNTAVQNGQKLESEDAPVEHKPLTNKDFAEMIMK